ncbi:hypothetical protein GDO78_017251 [Eleutherodactylus coqui]|uniref:Taste receptor type 2 n=1 Tax=Eleutherodactylus coqui TaxID=57060 RepID=A0A8J6E7K5_ELECQ|nr:hypothetical protein GDO78_017251 [Eleutherodactylus coqui]
MCVQCANTLFLVMHIFFSSSVDSLVFVNNIGSIYDFFICANFWLTSLLSIVLCLKISNFHSRLFLYLKGMIAHRTVYFIGASVLLSTVNSLVTLITFTEDTDGGTYNTIMANLTKGCTYTNFGYIYTVGATIPFLFSCISSVLLFTSLYHHTAKMKMSNNLSINLETYYSVMKFVCFTFINNTLYFIGHFVCTFFYFFYCVSLDWNYYVLDLPPILHSSYLIYRTPKLRSQMSKVLQKAMDFFLQRKDTETRDSIEVVAP